jgi:hypothetical protein
MSSATVSQRPTGWLWWISANVVGYAVGVALWQATYLALRPALSVPLGGIVSVAGFGATVGLAFGLCAAASTAFIEWLIARNDIMTAWRDT